MCLSKNNKNDTKLSYLLDTNRINDVFCTKNR